MCNKLGIPCNGVAYCLSMTVFMLGICMRTIVFSMRNTTWVLITSVFAAILDVVFKLSPGQRDKMVYKLFFQKNPLCFCRKMEKKDRERKQAQRAAALAVLKSQRGRR